jgi:hypothetical protein
MTDERRQRLRALFDQAADLPAADQRALLDVCCADDPDLRARVEDLLACDARLRAGEGAGGLLDSPLVRPPLQAAAAEQASTTVGSGPGGDLPAGTETAGALPRRLGRYELLEEIGHGGMGAVLRGHDPDLRRDLAVKVLLPELRHSPDVLRRFAEEAQIGGQLQHPGVVPVYEVGGAADQQPYFTMKLVKGRTLAALLAERRDPGQDLARFEHIFEQVCQTMAYAHSKGVIHRDLKPANVMVGAFGEVQVMDWGLAKVLTAADAAPPASVIRTSRSEAAGDQTKPGWVGGTPAYMAPEQAAGEAERLDERCDVFGLGAILCEILTGQPPYGAAGDPDVLFKAARADLAGAYARLDACGADGELIRLARGALAAEPTERPRDAGVLAAAMAAYRESIEARLRHAEVAQAEARARAAEERKRRRLMLGLGAFLLLAALLATWQAVRATRAEQAEAARAEGERRAKLDAQAQKANAEKAAAAEQAANAQAQQRLRQVEKANDLLGSIFANLDPREVARAERPLRAILVEKLGKAVEQLEGESIGEPLVVAAMQDRFGQSLIGLGEPGKAIVLLEKARATFQARLGPDHPNTLTSMSNLAVAYQDDGKLDLALPLFEETLKLRKARLGPDHPDTLTSMGSLASGYQAAGKLDLALPLLEETLKLMKARLGPDHPHTLTSMGNLAVAYQDDGKLDLAVPLLEETLKLRKADLGPEHPETLASRNNLAVAYQAAGKQELAVPLFEETLKLTKARLGPDHPYTLASMGNVAMAYQAAGKLDLALPLLEETLKLMKANLGPKHPDTLRCMNNLEVLRKLGTAQERYRVTLAKLGPDHIDTLLARRDLAQLYLATNRLDEAERILVEVIEAMKTRANDDPIRVFTIGLLRQCLTTRERALPDSWLTFRCQSLLGGALLGQKNYAAAEPLLRAGYAGMKKRQAKMPPQGKAGLMEAVERLVQLYEATDKKDEAAKWRKQREALRAAAKKPQTKP